MGTVLRGLVAVFAASALGSGGWLLKERLRGDAPRTRNLHLYLTGGLWALLILWFYERLIHLVSSVGHGGLTSLLALAGVGLLFVAAFLSGIILYRIGRGSLQVQKRATAHVTLGALSALGLLFLAMLF